MYIHHANMHIYTYLKELNGSNKIQSNIVKKIK